MANLVTAEGADRDIGISLTLLHLPLLQCALLQDLLDDLFVDVGAKLVLQRALGGAVKGTLGTVLAGYEDLERGYNLGQWDRLVVEPLLVVISAVEEDNEIVILALEVDLLLDSLTAGHDEGVKSNVGSISKEIIRLVSVDVRSLL